MEGVRNRVMNRMLLVHCGNVSDPLLPRSALCAGLYRREWNIRIVSLHNPFDLWESISYRLNTPKRSALFFPTSKNRFNHQTWKIPSAVKTSIWKILHHLTLEFVLSAVLRWVRSRTTMYDCSSLTWARSSESWRTRWNVSFWYRMRRRIILPSASNGSDGASASGTYTIPCTLKETSLLDAAQCSLLKQ